MNVGLSMRCAECNQYKPDRCQCELHADPEEALRKLRAMINIIWNNPRQTHIVEEMAFDALKLIDSGCFKPKKESL